jgi:hypothetical protein
LGDKPGSNDNTRAKLLPARIAEKKYCSGYDNKKQDFSFRNLVDCAKFAKEQSPDAKYFFMRLEGNWHCSPCPDDWDKETG